MNSIEKSIIVRVYEYARIKQFSLPVLDVPVSRNPLEMETILLAIASSSNIGSVQTVFGNPQLALIAATTSAEHFASSRLDLLRSLLYLGALALPCWY